MNEEITITLPLEDWMSITGALIFLERFDGHERLKNLADRINGRIISSIKTNIEKQ